MSAFPRFLPFLFLSLVASLAPAAERASVFSVARPVWAKGRTREMNLSLRFTATVPLTGRERKVIVHATGCSVYRLRVGGAFAGYGPARGPKGTDRVDVWDVTGLVREGKNAFDFDVAGYNVPNYYLPDEPAYLQAEIEADGKVVAATGRGDFSAHCLNRERKVPRYSYQRPFCEVWNVAHEVVGDTLELETIAQKPLLPRRAALPDFALNNKARKIAEGRVRYDAAAPVRTYWPLEEAGVKKDAGGFPKAACTVIPTAEAERYVADPQGAARFSDWDFGLLDCGFVGVMAKAHGKGRVIVTFDEVLTEGKVDFLRGGTANVVVWNFDGPFEGALESFEPYAFRYARFVADGDIELQKPYIRTYKSPLGVSFPCPTRDRELMKIFEAARETFRQNALDVFTDCPGRERAGWLCDSFFTARVSKMLTGSLDLEELFLENYLLADCPEIPKGMFPMCYPADHPSGSFIPNWAMWLVLQLEDYRARGGDGALIARFEPKVASLVEYLGSFENSDGLLENLPSWVFVEWSEANRHTAGVNYPSNMTWARVLEAVDALYGRPALREKAAAVRETIRRQSFDGAYFRDQALRGADGKLAVQPTHTETCQYYAFYFKTATRAAYPKLWKTLVEEFGPARKTRNAHPDVPFSNAFIGNYLRLELLLDAGLCDEVEANVRGYFLGMAEKTGTLWEHDRPSASCCHGFASYVAVILERLSHPARVDVCANSFREGGWKTDVQFMDAMGSPCLIAHGLGSPVPDATARATIPEDGVWRVFVRTRKWVEGAGRFQLLVNGEALDRTFGAGSEAWGWEDGGTVDLGAGTVRLALRDLDGFDARCAGVVFLKGRGAPEGPIRVTDRPCAESREFDFVVVGGGLPGCCAAVAAARAGLRVALVQDRPVPGGNASGEVRVWCAGEMRYPLVGELRGEFMNMRYENAFSDRARIALLERERNLSTFLFHRAFGVEKEGGRIAAVKALDVEGNRVVRFAAPCFCDATGDGWVGYWAGADFRYGREGRDETHERYAPEKGDRMTLGASIMWQSAVASYDVAFSAPWAEPYACGLSRTAGDWNWEFGLTDDILTDGERVRDRVLLAIYGAFSNAKKDPSNAHLKLVTCPFVLGKRETRRLLGDHIFCEQDVTGKTPFEDAVATGSWSVDLHYTIDEKIPFLTRCEQPHFGRYYLPYRSLYSRNVPNLFMAGRCFSCTHVGLGSPRVMNTLAQLGCAVGEAAAMCVKGGYGPRALYAEGHVRELQRRLGGDFPGNPDPAKRNWRFVDDEDAGVTFEGKWSCGWNCNGGQLGDRSHYPAEKGAKAVYPLPVAERGRYRLRGIVPHLFNYEEAPVVRLTVRSEGKATEIEWNELPGSGFWQYLATLALAPGATLTVEEIGGRNAAADGFSIEREEETKGEK